MNLKINSFTFLMLFCSLLICKCGKAQQTIGLFLNDSLSLNGYTLFTVNTDTYLIDNCGYLVNKWSSTRKPGLSVYLLENGDLLRPGLGGGGIVGSGMGGVIEKFSWEGDLIWTYTYAGNNARQHHDIEPMPNGNVLILAWESKSMEEAITAGRNPKKIGSQLLPEQVVEVKPVGNDEGEIVWEWNAWDHMVQDFDAEKDNYGIVSEHPELFNINYLFNENSDNFRDWMHANAIAYHPERDKIALSSRHFGEIWIIDHSTTTAEAASHEGGRSNKGGDLLYRWGNPQTYKRGSATDQKFFGQHDVQWIPKGYPNEGKIIVFNNGLDRLDGIYSTVDIIDPPINDEGIYQINDTEAYGPEDLYSTYRDKESNALAMSGAQPLSNGNILICYSLGMHFKEVSPEGKLVWEYISSAGISGPLYQGMSNLGNVFRSTRYASNYPAFIERDLSSQGPIELDPINYDCSFFGETAATENAQQYKLEIAQNPISNYLNIINKEGQKFIVRIFDVSGQLLMEKESSDTQFIIPAMDLSSGIYFVQLFTTSENKYPVLKKIIKK